MHKQLTMLFRRALCLIMLLALCLGVNAKADKTLLILNSYHEDELWGNSIVQPIMNNYAANDSVHCETMYLNGSSVPDIETYNTISNSVFDRYAEHHPSYVIMVGNFAFNLRDRIKEEWGDIPFLLITRSEGFGPLADYFTNDDNDLSVDLRQPCAEVRDQYNFSLALVPDYPKSTVTMMKDMFPQIDTLVFMADESYVNKVSAYNIYNFLLEEYPKTTFKWLKATDENAEAFSDYVSRPHPNVGLLMSSWIYETESTRGYPVLTTRDLSQIQKSVNPVFTMRKAYMSLGCLGGVFTDVDLMSSGIYKMVDDMIAGKSMRDIPFLYPENMSIKPHPVLSYPLLKKYGIKESSCPKGAVMYNRPPSYLEKYWLVILIVGVLALTLIVLLLRRNSEQRKKITLLRRHSMFVNNMPVAYISAKVTLDKANHVLGIKYESPNKAFESIVSKNTSGDDVNAFITAEQLGKQVAEVLATSQPKYFTHHFEGTDTYYDFALYPGSVEKANGNTCVLVDIFVRDITANYKMQKSLRDTAQVLDLAVDIAQIVPYKLNWSTRVISYDIAHNKDHKRGDTKLVDYMSQILPEDINVFHEVVAQLERGEITEFCVQYRVHDLDNPEVIRWKENRGAVTKSSDDGQVIQIIGSVRDITSAKEHEEIMAQALAKAEESDRMKSTFLANMSHEIRTPLNAIVGFSNMLIKETDEKAKRELFGVISKNNDLLLNLVNDVLDMARIESNNIDLTYSVYDVNDIIASIAKTMSLRIPKGVKINQVFYDDKCVVETDASRLTQILINLLTNACKFTTKGSITVGYEIHHVDNMLYFFVRDTGIGLSKENQKRVFEQFVKINSFAQGTGLGLTICRKLVEKMGGQIGVNSEGEGYGCTFWFTLPYHPVNLNEIDAPKVNEVHDEDVKKLLGINAEADDGGDGDNQGSELPLVIVAEDNESNYWLMKHMLSNRYRLVNAPNGKEAVEMYQKLHPDLIIMDINMPIMDGYQAVAEIRKISKDVPIIAVTAYAFASDRVRILECGFDAYVPKPVTEISLFTAISQVMHKE